MQLKMFNNKALLNYNPIVNPIPIVNQNPYINKGQIDYVPQVKVRGKIEPRGFTIAPNGANSGSPQTATVVL